MAYNTNYTKTEKDLIDFIKKLGFIPTKNVIAGYTLTGYIPEKNVAIEYVKCDENDNLHVERSFHYWKTRKCSEAGIRVIYIWEDQLNNDRLWPTLQGIIKGALGVNTEVNTIYARKCQIRELDNKTYREFCDKNHTQKTRAAEIKLGLYYNNELVQVASFNKANSRNGVKVVKDSSKYDYEWVRGSFLGNYECLTENGWKRLDTMNTYKGKVAQWNRETKQIEWTTDWQPVKEKKEQLTTITCSKNLIIEGNPEHTLPIINRDNIRDSWLINLTDNTRDRILGSITPTHSQENIDPVTLKNEIINIIVQASGCVCDKKIYFKFVEKHKIDKLKYYFNLFNIPYTESDEHIKSFKNSQKVIKTIACEYTASSDLKKLHFDLPSISKEKAEFLFTEMSFWNKSVLNNKHLSYSSNDKENADAAYNLLLLSGRKPVMFKRKTTWVINMNKYNSKGSTYSLKGMKKETKPWNDYLYCLSVPSHYFIVRDSNNHMFITHNCESFNQSRVQGGVSKLFNYFIKQYNPESVLCYSDFNFFCGLGYSKSGFVLDGYTGADKFYINEEGKRINRSASRYKEYMANVASGKWLLCYGAGNLRMIWKKPDDKKTDK